MTVKTSQRRPTSLQTFLIIWGGQLVSTIGSNMTSFAIAIWAWELTGKATPLSLIFNIILYSHAHSHCSLFCRSISRPLE
ncbi:hypothetical protein [Dapis sp. BLCC M229]|uniref:hypothetical protein n=1 Tax=Dapis sp. BLCC M229 TaxID=3400188 RepID=UPI003CEBD95E